MNLGSRPERCTSLYEYKEEKLSYLEVLYDVLSTGVFRYFLSSVSSSGPQPSVRQETRVFGSFSRCRMGRMDGPRAATCVEETVGKEGRRDHPGVKGRPGQVVPEGKEGKGDLKDVEVHRDWFFCFLYNRIPRFSRPCGEI